MMDKSPPSGSAENLLKINKSHPLSRMALIYWAKNYKKQTIYTIFAQNSTSHNSFEWLF
jgi:hypothetical protein